MTKKRSAEGYSPTADDELPEWDIKKTWKVVNRRAKKRKTRWKAFVIAKEQGLTKAEAMKLWWHEHMAAGLCAFCLRPKTHTWLCEKHRQKNIFYASRLAALGRCNKGGCSEEVGTLSVRYCDVHHKQRLIEQRDKREKAKEAQCVKSI